VKGKWALGRGGYAARALQSGIPGLFSISEEENLGSQKAFCERSRGLASMHFSEDCERLGKGESRENGRRHRPDRRPISKRESTRTPPDHPHLRKAYSKALTTSRRGWESEVRESALHLSPTRSGKRRAKS